MTVGTERGRRRYLLTWASSGSPFFSHLYVGRGLPLALHSQETLSSMATWMSLIF